MIATLHCPVPPAGSKSYPPGQVTDLSILTVDLSGKVVTLTWTAPGAELDKGSGRK